MFSTDKKAPIGVFDSGVGGLTVAHAIKQEMPNEGIFFYGDTAHLPYGDKSEAHIRSYADRIVEHLLNKGCKAIVIACNSASVSAYEHLAGKYGSELILDVINPVISEVAAKQYRRIGVVGTKRTIGSDVYQRRLIEIQTVESVQAIPTPLLAPMVEEGLISGEIATRIVGHYLQMLNTDELDTLLLACTHYPLLKDVFQEILPDVRVIDSSIPLAKELKKRLANGDLLNELTGANDEFEVSDYTIHFQQITSIFFGNEVSLRENNLFAP